MLQPKFPFTYHLIFMVTELQTGRTARHLACMCSGNLYKPLVENFPATQALGMSNFRQKTIRKQTLKKYGVMLKYEFN